MGMKSGLARLVGNTWVEFRVDARGFFGFDTPVADSFVYESADCTGTPLVIADPNGMMSTAFTGLDEVETYAILPGSPRMFHSESFFPQAGQPCPSTVLPNGMCCRMNIPPVPKRISPTRRPSISPRSASWLHSTSSRNSRPDQLRARALHGHAEAATAARRLIASNRGQRHVDNRRHHERDARAEDRGQEDPVPGVRRASGGLRRRAHDGGVAGGPLGDDHLSGSPSGSITGDLFVERVRSGEPARRDDPKRALRTINRGAASTWASRRLPSPKFPTGARSRESMAEQG